jgi:nucleoside-diphosphate-sugar epimerase
MNILITGAFGFVGTNLSKAIKTNPNHHLIAVDVFQPENHAYDEYFDWDSINSLDWNNIEVIIHLAGKAHDTKNTTNGQVYFQINLGLTQHIFDYFLKSPVKKFIFFSSVKAVADEVLGEILTEKTTPNPKTAYGMSKLVAEKLIQDHKITEDKKVYILRPCMIHGPGNKGNLNLLYSIVQK